MTKKVTDEGDGYNTNFAPPPPVIPGPTWAQLQQIMRTPAISEKRRESEGGGVHYYNYATNPAWQNAGRVPGGQGSGQGTGGAGGAGDTGPVGPSGPPPLTWDQKYSVAGAPSWWKGLVPSQLDPNTEYLMLLNSLIPFMSPEDQRTAASNIARTGASSGGSTFDAFRSYDPANNPLPTAPIPDQMAGDIRNQFTGQDRANSILGTLNQLATIMGKSQTDFGPGYSYLRDLAATERDYGGTQAAPQTRRQYLQEVSALDPLLAESKGQALSAYGPAAQMLTQPFFSGGPLRNATKLQGGGYDFGAANKKLYG